LVEMIYCVVPPEYESEYERLTDYYRENPGVEVIVDRRHGGAADRRRGRGTVSDERRIVRDRRRPRAIGSFPRAEAYDVA
jgi:hypothetical protein